jgi:hypothetical protein
MAEIPSASIAVQVRVRDGHEVVGGVGLDVGEFAVRPAVLREDGDDIEPPLLVAGVTSTDPTPS